MFFTTSRTQAKETISTISPAPSDGLRITGKPKGQFLRGTCCRPDLPAGIQPRPSSVRSLSRRRLPRSCATGKPSVTQRSRIVSMVLMENLSARKLLYLSAPRSVHPHQLGAMPRNITSGKRLPDLG